MLLIIKFLAKTLSVLNSELSPYHIAAGFAFGAMIGLVPIGGLLPLSLLLIGFILNINIPMMMVSAGIFKLISFLIDPAANRVGFALLAQTRALKHFWTVLYNMPIVPYTRFNNTIVLGSLVIGIVLFVPIYLIGLWAVRTYRRSWRDRILKLKIVQIFKASTFYKYYLAYKGLSGK